MYGGKNVEVWTLSKGQKINSLSALNDGLYAMAISGSSQLAAFAGGGYGSGGHFSLWNLKGVKELGYGSFGDMPMQALAFSRDDSVLAVGSDDGFVLLYETNKIRGPETAKQDHALCGEILNEDGKTFIVPLSKVSAPMMPDFDWAWRTEILNFKLVDKLEGDPVVLNDWSLVTSAAGSQIKIDRFESLNRRTAIDEVDDHIIFGEIHNPGWNEGSIIKIYKNGSFVATSNGSGKCLAFGSLDQLKTDFETIKERLLNSGFLSIPKEPLTLGADHYGTEFIEVVVNGKRELRTSADDIGKLLSGGKAEKREAFNKIYSKEQEFIELLLKSGLKH